MDVILGDLPHTVDWATLTWVDGCHTGRSPSYSGLGDTHVG